MAAAAPVPSLEAGDPSPGKVSFKETTEMIEATWGPGADGERAPRRFNTRRAGALKQQSEQVLMQGVR